MSHVGQRVVQGEGAASVKALGWGLICHVPEMGLSIGRAARQPMWLQQR